MLTENELQILLLRKQGLLQTEIATRLKITQSAVSRFEANANRKIVDMLTDLEVLKQLNVDHKQQPLGVEEKVRRWSS